MCAADCSKHAAALPCWPVLHVLRELFWLTAQYGQHQLGSEDACKLLHQCTGASALTQPCSVVWDLDNAVGSAEGTASAYRLHTKNKRHDRQALYGSTASGSLEGCCCQSLTFQKTPAFLLRRQPAFLWPNGVWCKHTCPNNSVVRVLLSDLCLLAFLPG